MAKFANSRAHDGALQAAVDGQQGMHPALAGMLLRTERERDEAASTSACERDDFDVHSMKCGLL